MEDFQHIVYSKEVIEFTAVAKEFCDFVETAAANGKKNDFLNKLQKFIPLVYLKGSLLPACESDEVSFVEDSVTEEDYNALYASLHQLLGEDDDYLEVFDDNMQYHETPIVNSIAEKICDIYQDLKNFITSYRHGLTEIMEEALWLLNNNFELYWGKSCTSVLRAIHLVIYKVTDQGEVH